MKRLFWPAPLAPGLALVLAFSPLRGQEKSVRPGINKPFENPDVPAFVGKFEVESREVYAKRKEIVAACKVRPGMAVADVGAGTGLFTRLLATEVGPQGKVYAVDIAPKFVAHVGKTAREQGLKNVVGVVCKADSVGLPPGSIDLAFICDTYHHFEYPQKTMRSIHRALRPGGQVVLVDFKRIPGVSSDWVLGHVRAGQEVFTREVVASGFKVVGEEKLLKDNYLVRFEKVAAAEDQQPGKAGSSSEKKPGRLEEQSVDPIHDPVDGVRFFLPPPWWGRKLKRNRVRVLSTTAPGNPHTCPDW
jgi:ubiquinone/menaquinone biosynthesis C-methylase UbiE